MNEIIIPAGTSRHLLLINEASSSWHIVQEEGSSLIMHLVFMNPLADAEATLAHTISIEQCAPCCSTALYGMAVLRQKQRVDWTTSVRHKAVNGKSNQLFKYILYDQAVASFHGELYIQQNAQHISASQTNRNILLSSRAHMTTQPELQIYADDVQASHGASTGQLDEAAMFYMQQRCIDRSTATRLLLRAFLADVLVTLPDESDRLKLENALDGVIQ